MIEITAAAVIGAGVMGAGIAAQLADAGLAVTLLDLEPALAEAGVAHQLAGGGFIDPAAAGRIRTGSSVTDLALIGDADWIIEAVAERLEVKHRIFEALNAVRKPGSIVSSNTSTIRLANLTSAMPAELAGDYLIAHFFNPPRWMRLLELVAGPATRSEAADAVAAFAAERLDKVVVRCRDTPGFLANRIGNFWMARALHEAVTRNLDVEDVDAVIGKPFGAPSGVFVLLDLVGIDLVPSGWRSLQSALPADDPFQDYSPEPPLICRMIAEGRTGRKAGMGFIRRGADKQFDVLDLSSGEYRPMHAPDTAPVDAAGSDLRALLSHPSEAGRLAASVVGRTLAYAAALVPEVADTPQPVDLAMRYGYGWQQGPFELIDRIGADWLADWLASQGLAIPPYLAEQAANRVSS